MSDLKQLIREIPDWPKPGILFYDITTLMKDGPAFNEVIEGPRNRGRAAGAT